MWFSPCRTCLPCGVLWPVDVGPCHCWPVVCRPWSVVGAYTTNTKYIYQHHDVALPSLCSFEAAVDIPEDAAAFIPDNNIGQNRSILVGPLHHRRPQPNNALLVTCWRPVIIQRQHRVAFGDNDTRCKGSKYVRRSCGTSRKAGGTELNDPTINPLEYKTQYTHIIECSWEGCGMELSLSCSCKALWSIGRAAKLLWTAQRPTKQSNYPTVNSGVWLRRREMIGVLYCYFRWLILPRKHNTQQVMAYYTNTRDDRRQQYNNCGIHTTRATREHQMEKLGANNQVNNTQNTVKMTCYFNHGFLVFLK